MDKPRCPKHPQVTVIPARGTGEFRKQWICLECGARLGDAGPVDFDWERVHVNDGDVGKLDDDNR